METVITGTPTPKVEWTHNGNVVKSGSGIKKVEKDNIYSLIIDKVEQIFDGDYCVKAVNASGSVQTSANLTVQGIYIVCKKIRKSGVFGFLVTLIPI